MLVDKVENPIQADIENSNKVEKEIIKLPVYVCKSRILLTVRQNIDNLNSSHIDSLLLTMDSSCKNNVEFGQFSNELLFMVLQNETELFLTQFDKLINEIDTSFIFFQLRHPLHDQIDVTDILERIEKVPIENSTKAKFIEIMKINVSKYND